MFFDHVLPKPRRNKRRLERCHLLVDYISSISAKKNGLRWLLMLQWGWYCRCLWKFSNHSCGMKGALASMASLLTTSISPSLLQTTPWKFSHSGREEFVWNASCFTSFRGISGLCWQPTPSQLEANSKLFQDHGMMVIWGWFPPSLKSEYQKLTKNPAFLRWATQLRTSYVCIVSRYNI